ncbi:16S rRNA (cytosine(967)-C(5))-methyltransferase [Oscillatoria salina]|uniref:16S rRNA (cytosine(967)-C(5))-methyltransferase n=1 Tax=Oscillatoria salina TaxID=331517 RepID=UPI001CCD24F1|nr:16S rRNA (cytosine(967)-C(5))-methyltransferase [Oscillatoria salina]
MSNPRQLAFVALRDIYLRGAYSEIALNRVLAKSNLSAADRGLLTELVYGVVRRQRSLDAIIDQLGKKKAHQQPPDLRIILHIGLYQLRYLAQIPDSAAVNTTVELAKENKFSRLAGVVNGLLRQYLRLAAHGKDPLRLPEAIASRLGILYSFPDWIVENWLEEWGFAETEQLCAWFNQPPTIDLRVNIWRTSLEEVSSALMAAGVTVASVPHLPQALRITGGAGKIQDLPGFREGWWTIQDSSAQLVSYLLDPQPEDVVIDACAAPGGKTTHIAELMADRGTIWACDAGAKRLAKVAENAQRLQLQSLQCKTGDSRDFPEFINSADRVLVDAPCSGLGTLHRRSDLRWRQTPSKIQELAKLQGELLDSAASWVKPEGILVYATCTLNRLENEVAIASFCDRHPDWKIDLPVANSPVVSFATDSGWIKILPHQQQMDGFFMVKLKRQN